LVANPGPFQKQTKLASRGTEQYALEVAGFPSGRAFMNFGRLRREVSWVVFDL
jgi:hypothetical protein